MNLLSDQSAIDRALAEGWELVKSSSNQGYFLLMPPLKDRRRGTSAIWHRGEFRGKQIMVPSYD